MSNTSCAPLSLPPVGNNGRTAECVGYNLPIPQDAADKVSSTDSISAASSASSLFAFGGSRKPQAKLKMVNEGLSGEGKKKLGIQIMKSKKKKHLKLLKSKLPRMNELEVKL